MAFSTTSSEKKFFNSTAGEYDAPHLPYLSDATYVVAPNSASYSSLNTGYGLTNPNIINGDLDVYHLGTLNEGIYELDVDWSNWDFSFSTGNNFGTSVKEYGITNSTLTSFDSGTSLFTNVEFTVDHTDDVYAYVWGQPNVATEYSISFYKTGDLPTSNVNTPAIFLNATYNFGCWNRV